MVHERTSPTSGSVLTAQSLEPPLDAVCVSLSAPPPHSPLSPFLSLPLSLALSLSKINIKKKKKIGLNLLISSAITSK